MFSSSPVLSALEHPLYDVTVVGCEKANSPKVQKPASPEVEKVKSRTTGKPTPNAAHP